MRIVLLRHGEPDVDRPVWPSAKAFGDWIGLYDAAGIKSLSRPSDRVVAEVGSCRALVCSDLPRSLASARVFADDRVVSEAMFRELGLPYAGWTFPRLPLGVWLLLFRLAWLMGFSAQAEPFRAAKTRGWACCMRLIELAETHGSVALLGHGALNWLIARELRKQGWSLGEGISPHGYWGDRVYEKP